MNDIDPSMFELFREEVRSHADTLARGLLEVEADSRNASLLEQLMRAAHSIKGACRIVRIEVGVRLAHVMEDALVAAQAGTIRLASGDVDLLLKGSDVLASLAELTPTGCDEWESTHATAAKELEPALLALATGKRAIVPDLEETRDERAISSEAWTSGSSNPATNDSTFPLPPPFAELPIPIDPLRLGADHSMLDLFREELRANLLGIRLGLGSDWNEVAEGWKQIRGAARILKCAPIERIAAGLWNFANAVRESLTQPSAEAIRWIEFAVTTLGSAIARDDETYAAWLEEKAEDLERIAEIFEAVRHLPVPPQTQPTTSKSPPATTPSTTTPPRTASNQKADPAPASTPTPSATPSEAFVRVTAQSLNRLMGLAGESLVQARWLPTFSTALAALRKQHDLLASSIDRAFHSASDSTSAERMGAAIASARQQASVCRSALSSYALDFDDHAARAEDLNARLYREVILSRMRPFGDGVRGLPRLVRDMARSLGKEARLSVEGEKTEVDRDILEKLESPLTHLVRNAVDHGIELPEVRNANGKEAVGAIRIEARHRAGMLNVAISDDGSGIEVEKLRQKIVERRLSAAEVVSRMNQAELFEFLFLPGFSTATEVTEFSGRGVGLDVVQDTIRKVGGSVRISSERGRGTTFHLQLPLTLSVIRAVVVTIADEPYAFPHTRIDRLVRIRRSEVRSLEHRQFFTLDGRHIGLLVASQLLDLPPTLDARDELAIVLLSDPSGAYGLIVDSFRGEQDLVVRPLDARLGKVPNLSAAAILDDGSPVLIVDVEDLLRTTDQFIQTGALKRCETQPIGPTRKKRILVVDDSITVREVERQLLLHRGYDVSIAVDGMDGWNRIRAEDYDLLITDVDMPRMTGIQLASAVRKDERLKDLPIVIVSYKEREEDRMRGLEVGANCYLTKTSFHDNRFIEAVEDLIGSA